MSVMELEVKNEVEEMEIGLPKLIEVKLPRIPKEVSTFGQDDEMYARAEKMMRDYIDTWKDKGANLFYSDHGNPKEKTHVEFCICEPMKALGFMDDFDDNFVHCRVFSDKIDYIKDEYKMCGCFGGTNVNGRMIPHSFIRMELRKPGGMIE